MVPSCEEGRGLWRGRCPPPASAPAGRVSGSEPACLLGSLATKNLTNIPVYPGHLEPWTLIPSEASKLFL